MKRTQDQMLMDLMWHERRLILRANKRLAAALDHAVHHAHVNAANARRRLTSLEAARAEKKVWKERALAAGWKPETKTVAEGPGREQ